MGVQRNIPTLYFAPPSVTAAVVVDVQDVGDFTQYLFDVTSAATSTTHLVEATLDNISWRAIPFMNLDSATAAPTTNSTSAGLKGADISGFKAVRLRVSAFGTGTFIAKSAMTYSPYALDQAITALGSGALDVRPAAPSSNANVGTLSKVKAAASTNLTAVKTSGGRIVGGILHNTTAAAIFIKFYDTAAPVVGTTAPTFTLRIPPNGELSLANAFPTPFATAIRYALTTSVTETDATAVALDSVVGFIQYV